jgi:hypothetical protein
MTGQPEFANDDAVIEFAVQQLFNQLKKQKVV